MTVRVCTYSLTLEKELKMSVRLILRLLSLAVLLANYCDTLECLRFVIDNFGCHACWVLICLNNSDKDATVTNVLQQKVFYYVIVIAFIDQ